MTSDGTNTLTWDRAGRLLEHNGVDNAYNGLGQRVQQTVNSIVTEYLLDVQPGLFVTLAETASGQTKRFVHGPKGIHSFQDNSGDWAWTIQDGLNSVRGQGVAGFDGQDWDVTMQATRERDPYGGELASEGTFGMDYGFTGEPTDDNDLVYLRARYLNPELGVFPSLDPFEGVIQQAMSLNGYSWVDGNVINRTDPSGKWWFWGPLNPLIDARGQVSARVQGLAMWGRDTTVHAEYPIPYNNLATLPHNEIPEALLSLLSATQRIDLLDTFTGEIWEIKPIADVLAGIGQVLGYFTSMVALADLNLVYGVHHLYGPYDWNGVVWKLGTSYVPAFLGTDESGTWSYFAEQSDPGVIVWFKSRNRNRRVDNRPYRE